MIFQEAIEEMGLGLDMLHEAKTRSGDLTITISDHHFETEEFVFKHLKEANSFMYLQCCRITFRFTDESVREYFPLASSVSLRISVAYKPMIKALLKRVNELEKFERLLKVMVEGA